MSVTWTAGALEYWRRLPIADAREMARAIQRFADTSEGFVIPGDGGTYLLFVGSRVAVLLIDRDAVYVVHVRRA